MWRVARALLLVLGVAGLGARTARSEEPATAAEARYAREQLLAEARRAVRPEEPLGEGLQPFRDALEADRQALPTLEGLPPPLRRLFAETVETRSQLLGTPPPTAAPAAGGAPGPVGPAGALAEARWLHRWLRGLEGCGLVVHDLTSSGPPSSTSIEWPMPAAGGTGASAAPPQDLAAWAADVKAKLGGSLLRRRIEPAVCTPLSDLARIAAAVPAYLPSSGLEVPQRHAFAGSVASAFDVNEPFLRLRELQSAERVEAYGKDAPTGGLVDEPTVRERARRATELREEAVRLRGRRADVLAEIDRMALSSADAWRQVLGTLSAQLEDAKRAAGSSAPAAPDGEPPPPVRVLEAQESTAILDLRLLHLTALRSDLRLRLLDRWIALVDAEALAAEGAHARYADALAGLRRERQLVRLEFERDRRLRRSLEAANAWPAANPGADPQRVQGVQARSAMLEALLDVNSVVLQAARLRRAVHERLQPRAAAAGTPKAAEASPPAAEPAATSPNAVDPLAGLRNPETSALEEAYLATALEKLRDPTLKEEFDATLVARHHDAVDRRLVALRDAIGQIADGELQALQARFDVAVASARDRLAKLREFPSQRYGARDLGNSLETHIADFADAVAGLRADAEGMRQRAASLSSYRSALRNAGSRSFRIRGRQGVTAEGLARAAADVRRTADRALGWATTRSEENAVTFGRERWPGVLLLLALVVGAAWGVRWGRRRLDRSIDARVASIPLLWATGASPAGEQEDAQANVELRKAAAKEAEERALRQAAGDATVAPPEPPRPAEPPPAPPPPATADTGGPTPAAT
jgi:hypothetical protein